MAASLGASCAKAAATALSAATLAGAFGILCYISGGVATGSLLKHHMTVRIGMAAWHQTCAWLCAGAGGGVHRVHLSGCVEGPRAKKDRGCGKLFWGWRKVLGHARALEVSAGRAQRRLMQAGHSVIR